MTIDLREGLRALHEDELAAGADLPVGGLVGRARRRRALVRTGYGAVGAGTAAALAVGGTSLAGAWRQDAPPVTVTPTPSPTPAPTPTPSPTATPTPAAEIFTPELWGCGQVIQGGEQTADLWVGDSGGGTGADVGAPIDLSWSAITAEDWSGHEVTVSPLALWLTDETGTVVAVPDQPLPAPSPLVMAQGSEGGGVGSESGIRLTTGFLACPDGTSTVPSGEYQAWLRVELGDGTTRLTAWGMQPVLLPVDGVGDGTDAPANPDGEAPFVVVPRWDELGGLGCTGIVGPVEGGSVVMEQYHDAAMAGGPVHRSVLPAGFQRDADGTTIEVTTSYTPADPTREARYAVVSGTLSPFWPGSTPLEGHAVSGTIGEFQGIYAVASPEPTRTADDGSLDLSLPFLWCLTSPGSKPAPDGLWVLHARIAIMVGDVADTFWVEELVAVGDVELPG